MRPHFTLLSLGLGFLLFWGCSEGDAARVETAQSSPEAKQILSAADAFYRKQPACRVSSTLEAVLHDASGSRIESIDPLIDKRELLLGGDEKFELTGNEFRVASNGANAWLSPAKGEIYWRTEAFSPLALANSPLAPLFGGPDNVLMLGLLEPGLEAAMRITDQTVITLEASEVDGKGAHHLVIKEAVQDSNPHPVGVSELWIASTGDPVILQVKHTPVTSMLQMGRNPIEGAIVSVETYAEWKFGEIPETEFVAPAGARRVADLGQIMRGVSPMIGQPATDATLLLLDGSTVTLSQLQAQQKIVMLDFWATWCGPCRQELPFVSKIAADFAKQGVVFYGVNQQESIERVRAFQSNLDYEFTATLDQSGELSTQFGATSLPYLCIIGRDGTVQAVHVGVGPDTESSIRDELSALVDGRNLAKEGLPE